MTSKIILYDFTNEDDDFLDLDKDEMPSVTKDMEGVAMPMPILATGFDFDDFQPDFKKGAERRALRDRNEKLPVRYTSKRYGGKG